LVTRDGYPTAGEGVSKAILISGLYQDCFIDLTKEFEGPTGQKVSVYGDFFEGGPSTRNPLLKFGDMITKEVIKVYETPIKFNIFCMTAPTCGGYNDQPITLGNIEDLFQTAFTTYSLIKQSTDAKYHPKVLGGYWGAGIFLNHPRIVVVVQLMAAQMTGVDIQFHDFPAKFYPGHYEAAKLYFDKELSPKIQEGAKIGKILDSFYSYVHKQGWKYSRSNPVPNAT